MLLLQSSVVVQVANRCSSLDLTCSCRVVYMEPLTLQQQIETYASSQVLLMTHGAALVNILFMPEVQHSCPPQLALCCKCDTASHTSHHTQAECCFIQHVTMHS